MARLISASLLLKFQIAAYLPNSLKLVPFDYVLQLLLPGNEQALQQLSNIVQALRAQNEARVFLSGCARVGLGARELAVVS